jgi:hypothetical protein
MSRLGLLLLAASAVLTAIANLSLRPGLDRAGGFRLEGLIAAIVAFAKLLCEPLFAAGSSFISLFRGGARFGSVSSLIEPLSTAYPVIIGLTFVMVSVGAIFFFSEPVSIREAMGLAVMVAGIVIASTTGAAQIP